MFGKASIKFARLEKLRHYIEGILHLMSQGSDSRFGWRLCGILVLGLLIFASLLLPPQLEHMRTGHWEIEHFLAYLMAVPIICLGWPRPFLVAITLLPAAALLEVLQCLRPDHSPNFFAAFSSIGGVLVGALLASLMIRALDQISSRRRNAEPVAGLNTTAEG
jgi:hypothetical protein